MAGAVYQRHVKGDALKTGDVLVFNDYYEVLGRKLGYVSRTDPYSRAKTREKVKFSVAAYHRDGSSAGTHVREYRLAMEFPAGKLV